MPRVSVDLPLSGPMEQVDNPVMRDYFARTRGALGMDLLPMQGVAPMLVERIRRGEAVALVADRVIGGQGTRVQLFGAAARLPAGPAILALETGSADVRPGGISKRAGCLGRSGGAARGAG